MARASYIRGAFANQYPVRCVWRAPALNASSRRGDNWKGVVSEARDATLQDIRLRLLCARQDDLCKRM